MSPTGGGMANLDCYDALKSKRKIVKYYKWDRCTHWP